MNRRLLSMLSLAVLVLISCAGPAEEPAPAPEAGAEGPATPAGTRDNPFVGRGTVQEIQAEERQIVIQHEEIPGFMAAMTMSFPVAPEVPIETLEAGDAVMFNVEMLGDNQWQIFSIEEEAAPAGAEPAGEAPAGEAAPE